LQGLFQGQVFGEGRDWFVSQKIVEGAPRQIPGQERRGFSEGRDRRGSRWILPSTERMGGFVVRKVFFS